MAIACQDHVKRMTTTWQHRGEGMAKAWQTHCKCMVKEWQEQGTWPHNGKHMEKKRGKGMANAWQ
eukprot:6092054-Lingulodinium_polyedra.AAC.1